MKPRLRFSPSPTGFVHIGSLRTVLYNYLATKSLQGTNILRIEDTDQSRKVEGSEKNMMEVLNWIGLDFDEGPGVIKNQGKDIGDCGPYIQSQRLEIYQKYADELIEKGEAYRCFCSEDRLAEMRKKQEAEKLPPRYDRTCRDLSVEEVKKKVTNGEKFVIRQKMPLDGDVIIHDELRGDIKFDAKELEDHVLMKSTGWPTYQLASVVDDHLMKITHVLRGEEWLPSFPKNILLYRSFGWTPPKFYHMPLILNKGGGKLSKRQGDVAVEEFREKGYLPEALINFCALLGWHPKKDQEIYTLEELTKEFKPEDMGVSPAIFDLEKLDFYNGYYIRHKNLDELTELCKPHLMENIKLTKEKRKTENLFLKNVVRLEQERLKKLSEIGERTKYFFEDMITYDPEMLIWKKSTKQEVKDNLEKLLELLDEIPEENWTDDSIEEGIMSHLKAKELSVGPYLWPMRVSLTGQKASPGPFEVAEVLGKKESMDRINAGIKKLS